jgi:bromodomain associated protein
LERVDASMKQQMRMIIPLKRMKESSTITPPTISPRKTMREERRGERVEAASALARILLQIVDELLRHPLVDPFARPVSKKKYPIYYRLIPKPRDLGTIRKKLVIQQQMSVSKSMKMRPRYTKGSQFLTDIELIHTNCLAFNGAEHAFTKTTTELLEMARRMYREREEEMRELEKIILGDKYLEGEEEEEEHAKMASSASEIEVEGETEKSLPDHSSLPPSSQQRPPMTELERMVMELGGNVIVPSEHPKEERGGGEGKSMPKLKLFLRK